MEVNITYNVPNEAPSPSPSVKIPLDHTKFIKLYNGYESLEPWVDGDVNTKPENDWSVFTNPTIVTYDFAGLKDVVIDRVRVYDVEGAMSPPMLMYAIDEYNQRVFLGSFNGSGYMEWVNFADFDPVRAKYIWFIREGQSGDLGERTSEIEVYGSYETDENYPITISPKPILLDKLLGSNVYEWNLLNNDNSGDVTPQAATLMAKTRIVRHYLDWSRVEGSSQLQMAFSPEWTGGWQLDNMYEWLSTNGILIHVCIQDTPSWMEQTWPSGQRDGKSVPVIYGSRFEDPMSYENQAMVAFNVAARYGSNGDIDPELIHVYTGEIQSWLPRNEVKTGLGFIHTLECGNETNRFWKGRTCYQTAREHAANLSAFYDGHKGVMSAGIGVKPADPNIKVSTQGSVDTGYEYFRGVIDWCKQYRGYKEDGTVDVPFDIIHFHRYNNDNHGQQGGGTTGVCPEESGFYEDVIRLRYLVQEFCPHVEIMLGETGYDYNQSSIQKAPPIGDKTSLEVIGDWNLRTILEAARAGVDYLTFYQMYDDTILDPSTTYATCGIASESGYTNRPTIAYMKQIQDFMLGFSYVDTVSESPRVVRWSNGNEHVYVLWMPTSNDSTDTYELEFDGTPASITRYEMDGIQDTPDSTTITPDSSINVSISETPVFIKID